MGLILELEDSDFAGYIDDGVEYPATISSIKLAEKRYKDDDGNPVKRFAFRFKITSNDDHDGDDLYGETSTKFVDHPNCKLKHWAEAVLGMRLPPRFRLDLDTLLDRRCTIVVGQDNWEDNGQRKTRNFVRDVKPSPEAAKALALDDETEPF